MIQLTQNIVMYASERSSPMVMLTLEVPEDLYTRMQQVADQIKQPLSDLITTYLEQRFTPPAPAGEREQALALLRSVGLLTELGPSLQQLASQSTLSLHDVQAIFTRVGGTPLSELAIQQRERSL